MSDRISPWRQTTIGSQEIPISSFELDLRAFSDGFPLDRGIKATGKGLKHFPAGHSEQKGLIAGGEVVAVAAFETDE